MSSWDKAYMNARRHPRTMSEAFGPYTSRDLQPMPEPHDYGAAWWWVMAVVAAATFILIFTTR